MDIVASAAPPLHRAAALLPRSKRQLFDDAYKAMRRMDDFVDEDFLRQPAAQRELSRAAAHKHLNNLLDEAFVSPVARQDPRPWRALAAALARDIDERPVRTWYDFRAYALGAAVAPGMVFVQILTGETASHRTVRPFANFCYLTHILRDLRHDALLVAKSAAEQRLTVPLHLLGSLPRDDLATALQSRAPSAIRAVRAMIDETAGLKSAATAACARLCTTLPAEEATALQYVERDYVAQFAFMVEDPKRIATGRTNPTDSV